MVPQNLTNVTLFPAQERVSPRFSGFAGAFRVTSYAHRRKIDTNHSTKSCSIIEWTLRQGEQTMIENYEELSEKQIEILKQFVTNTDSNIFVLRNLPEVIKGALFSRYSRSMLGLRSLLLKDFILNEETNFEQIASAPNDHDDQVMAIQKAQNFYDRILDGYGDDSIGELGGAHLAVENISMLAAKEIEDGRIGGSPLEKSTRYIYFDQKNEWRVHVLPRAGAHDLGFPRSLHANV